jgi:serine protease Do
MVCPGHPVRSRSLPISFVLIVAVSCVVAGCSGIRFASSTAPGGENGALSFMSDRDITSNTLRGATTLMRENRTAKMATLVPQLERKQCSLALARPSRRALTPAEIYAKRRASVLLVCAVKPGCVPGVYHQSIAAGFALTESGVIVTNYHVVNQPDAETLVVGTADGRFFAVKEVLAADQKSDVAILQTEATGLTPASLALDAPVGSPVSVISHPDYHFYVLTQGYVSRYFLDPQSKAPRMAVTADFAKGSSGAPIFDEHGGVAGMVESTTSVYYNVDKG